MKGNKYFFFYKRRQILFATTETIYKVNTVQKDYICASTIFMSLIYITTNT